MLAIEPNSVPYSVSFGVEYLNFFSGVNAFLILNLFIQ